MYKVSMKSATTKRIKKCSKTPVVPLTKELVILVCKMKVMELYWWIPVLQHEETPKLFFEGYVCRTNGEKRRYTAYKTEPLDVRLGSYLFRQANGETCSLLGELYDPANSLPLSVKSKFKNGIPKKWQNVAKFWDSVQNSSFCRKQLRSFSSRLAWLESLKTSGVLRVSSRGRIIIPSPKYLKGKKVEQREIERADLINSHMEMIRTNLNLAPSNIIGDTEHTPRQQAENNSTPLNGKKSYQYENLENSTVNPLCKSNSFRKINAHNKCFKIHAHKNSMNGSRRSSINQRKVLTCKRTLIPAEAHNKMYRSGKTLKTTYEKITKKKYSRCLPHRRKYLLRSTSATGLLQKNNECKKEPRVASTNVTSNGGSVIPLKKQPLLNKRKLNLLNNKVDLLQCHDKGVKFSPSEQNHERMVSNEVASSNENVVQRSSVETKHYSDAFRNESKVNVENNKGCEALQKLPFEETCLPARKTQSDNVLRNCANRIRRSKQHACCQERGVPSASGLGRPKKKSENSPPQKVRERAIKTIQSTFDESGTEFSDKKSTGFASPSVSAKRQAERNSERIPTESQNSLQKKEVTRTVCEDISPRKRIGGKCVTLELNKRKDSQTKPSSNEKQRENRKSTVTCELNGKGLHKVTDKLRKKSSSTSNCTVNAISGTKITTEPLQEAREAVTTPSNASKRKVCKEDTKQTRMSDCQSSEETLPSLPSRDTFETPPRITEKTEHNLSLGDIEDILANGAPRTLKQRKKLRKTIDTYAKTQNTCTDLFSDPDYHHLIGDNDTCSTQEWDTDYAEAVEKLVSGKSSDQVSLGSTPPAHYLQDFISDDNQSVRSTSPFQRTPCDEDYKLRYVHRVLKEKNEHTRRKSLNLDYLASFAHCETDASTEADAAYTALIAGNSVPQKLFDLKSRKNKTTSDDSSSECSEDSKIE